MLKSTFPGNPDHAWSDANGGWRRIWVEDIGRNGYVLMGGRQEHDSTLESFEPLVLIEFFRPRSGEPNSLIYCANFMKLGLKVPIVDDNDTY